MVDEWTRLEFNAWSRDKLRKGIKTCTNRAKQPAAVGAKFRVNLGQHGKDDVRTYVILKRRHVELNVIATFWWRKEGAEDRDDYIQVHKDIHPNRSWDPKEKRWLTVFEEVK